MGSVLKSPAKTFIDLMAGFKGCVNGVCSWEGTKYLTSVGVPGSLLESLTLKKAAEAATASEAMRSMSYTVYKAAPPPSAYVPAPTRTIVTTNGAKNDSTLMALLAGIAIGVMGLGLAIAYNKSTPPPAPPVKPPSVKHEPLRKDMHTRVADLWHRMDVTKSGGVDLEDLRILGYRSKDASWILDHIDTDKDGVASLDEFISYFTARQAEVGEKKMLEHLAVFESEVEAHLKRHRLDTSSK